MTTDPDKIVVLFSGGQDSTTVLALAVDTAGADNVTAVSCLYGQRHSVELECAKRITARLGIRDHHIVDLNFLGQSVTSALTGDGALSEEHARLRHLPASFVPGRNALMLTVAFAIAGEIGAGQLWSGVCQTDYSGYPDCREVFIKALEVALRVGYEQDTAICTPVMHLTKAETFGLAASIEALDLVVEESHTCYKGDRTQRHSWGYGCGVCPACQLRAKGWEEFRAPMIKESASAQVI